MKKWGAGSADEAWKALVSAVEAKRAGDLLSGLIYVLTDAGNDNERGADTLRKMSGAEIVDGLVKYQASMQQGVRNGFAACRAAEREACAEIADAEAKRASDEVVKYPHALGECGANSAGKIAKAIRART